MSSSAASASNVGPSVDGEFSRGDGTEFRDLLKGRIDIIDYINQSVDSPADLSSLSVVDGNLVAAPHTTAALCSSSSSSPSIDCRPAASAVTSTATTTNQQHTHAGLSTPPVVVLNPPPPSNRAGHRLHHLQADGNPQTTSSAGTAGPGPSEYSNSTNTVKENKPSERANLTKVVSVDPAERDSQKRLINMFGMAQTRLPDSPPETDSAGVSAGSPSSGSETSPYSPGFNNYPAGMHPSSVIQAAMQHQNGGLHVVPSHHPSHRQHANNTAGVILGVHNINNAPQQHNNNPFLGNPNQGPRTIVHHMTNGSQLVGNNNNNGSQQQPASNFVSPSAQTPSAYHAQPPPSALVSPAASSSTGAAPSPFMRLPPPPAHLPPGGHDPYSSVTPSVHSLVDGSPSTRKRLRSSDPMDVYGGGAMITTQPAAPPGGGAGVKPEPSKDKEQPTSPNSSDDFYDVDGYGGQAQSIRFNEFNRDSWHTLCDPTGREQSRVGFNVLADKGFNLSYFDTAFVNQKKNHFQITVHIEAMDHFPSVYVKVGEALKPIQVFKLNFFGCKAESTSTNVVIKQSTTDRKPMAYEPVELELPPMKVTTVTVPRLHFSETTMNNQRKNGRPNPDQKYLNLCVSLDAFVSPTESYTVVAFASEKVIVRASNPGQFDNGDSDVHWQKCANQGVYHPGPVCVGTDRPQGALTVGGDISYTGNLLHYSDRRLKENICEMDPSDALSNLSKLRIVSYSIRPEIAEEWGLSEAERERVGVIAQELEEILPDAIKENGEYLQVDDQRIAYETVGAVKELCRLTGNLDSKIAEVEKISETLRRYCKLKRLSSMHSTLSLAQRSEASSGVFGSHVSFSRASLPTKKECSADERRQKTDRRTDTQPQHTNNRNCHHTCNYDHGLCSNKVIQATIVVLVIVMAFCLVSMSTLYVVDWYKRNYPPYYVTTTTMLPTPSNSTAISSDASQKLGQIIVTRLPKVDHPAWHSPDWGGRAPPILAQCQKKMSKCPHYCCSNKKTPDIIALDLPTQGNAKEVSVHSLDENKQIDQIQRVKRTVHSLQEAEKEAPLDVRMHIEQYNTTIDRRYCPNNTCQDVMPGVYNFYVPVSVSMPLQSLLVHFHSDDDGRRAMSCGAKLAANCSDYERRNDHSHPSSHNHVVEKQENVFELPVGGYSRSSFTFRVGYTTEVCNATPKGVGKTFDEYTITFYRICQ